MAAVRLSSLSKHFGSTVALKDASGEFFAGEIHAIVGENGAGKSTWLSILAGLVVPDGGHVEIAGVRLDPVTPAEAARRGVGMVRQHFTLVEDLTVLENMILGREPGRGPFIDGRAARMRAEQCMNDLGYPLTLARPVRELSVGERQKLEILRLLYRSADVLILDEPTAALPPSEVDALYTLLRKLADQGKTVLVVTHKVQEVVRHANRVTVLRHGIVAGSWAIEDRTGDAAERIARTMMGGARPAPSPETPHGSRGGPVFSMRDVCVGQALRGASFEVCSGEIVGMAGVEGNGQRELVALVSEQLRPEKGTIWKKTPGTCVVYEDRQRDGLVLDATVQDNLMLGGHAQFQHFGFIDAARLGDEAQRRLSDGGVVPPDLGLSARALSGGNQQKIVVARGLASMGEGTSLLLLAHPTRGVDFAAQHEIHDHIRARRGSRVGILVLSHDLDELRQLADRILVLREGSIVAEFPPTATDLEIGGAMVGAGHTVASSREVHRA